MHPTLKAAIMLAQGQHSVKLTGKGRDLGVLLKILPDVRKIFLS